MQRQCPLCRHSEWTALYTAEELPLFQNVVFADRDDAKNTKRARIDLQECQNCQFVFNAAFDESQMNYDGRYQNEQGHSRYFGTYLDAVVAELQAKGFQNKRVIEIGCGKGAFISKLRQAGFTNTKGYDPAFEGNDPDIICDYYKGQSADEPADLIVLRHVLEHVAKPFDFLKTIAQANRSLGTIYIEVPDFQWIVRENAFWDIYNEHCNYFTSQTLSSLFALSECHPSFEDQYLSFFGDLSSLRPPGPRLPVKGETEEADKVCAEHIHRWKAILENHKHHCIVVWGAASKGVIFANLIDPHAEIVRVFVDINPKKQGMYIGGTGHKIISPVQLKEFRDSPMTIIVANKNYLDEIKQEVKELKPQILTLSMGGFQGVALA